MKHTFPATPTQPKSLRPHMEKSLPRLRQALVCRQPAFPTEASYLVFLRAGSTEAGAEALLGGWQQWQMAAASC